MKSRAFTLLMLLFVVSGCLSQVVKIPEHKPLRITFNYTFADTSGTALDPSDVVFDFSALDSRDDTLIDSVDTQGFIVVGDTIKIQNFGLQLPQGSYVLAAYARILSNGNSSVAGFSNVFEIISSAIPAKVWNVIVEMVETKP